MELGFSGQNNLGESCEMGGWFAEVCARIATEARQRLSEAGGGQRPAGTAGLPKAELPKAGLD